MKFTPIWSIAKTILTVEPYSYVYLLYGNQDEENIIFKEAIAQWQQQYPQRFSSETMLSKPLSHQWSALFKSLDYWSGKVGRIDAQAVSQFINDNPPQAQRVNYLICGPNRMIPTIRDALMALDVAAEDIVYEYFGNSDAVSTSVVSNTTATLRLNLAGEKQQITVPEGNSLLTAMLAQGIAAPHACKSGVCGACKAHLLAGKMQMKSHIALSASDLKQGILLTCQAYAQTKNIEIAYLKA